MAGGNFERIPPMNPRTGNATRPMRASHTGLLTRQSIVLKGSFLL